MVEQARIPHQRFDKLVQMSEVDRQKMKGPLQAAVLESS